MCINPDEQLLTVKRGRTREHHNPVECYYDSNGCLRIIFYPPFWETFGKFVGMNDFVRLYSNKDMTYLRLCPQPVRGENCYKMSKRPGCPSLRQIVLPTALAVALPHHDGRKVLGVTEEKRSIILSF